MSDYFINSDSNDIPGVESGSGNAVPEPTGEVVERIGGIIDGIADFVDDDSGLLELTSDEDSFDELDIDELDIDELDDLDSDSLDDPPIDVGAAIRELDDVQEQLNKEIDQLSKGADMADEMDMTEIFAELGKLLASDDAKNIIRQLSTATMQTFIAMAEDEVLCQQYTRKKAQFARKQFLAYREEEFTEEQAAALTANSLSVFRG